MKDPHASKPVLILSGFEVSFENKFVENTFDLKVREGFQNFMEQCGEFSRDLTRLIERQVAARNQMIDAAVMFKPNLAGLVLGAALQKERIPYDILTGFSLDLPDGQERLKNAILAGDYRIIGLSTSFIFTVNFLKHLSRQIRFWKPDCKIVVGGPFIVKNEPTWEIPEIDYYVFGDGEETFPRLVKALLDKQFDLPIAGVLRRENDRLTGNPENPLVDLDRQSLPAWETFLNEYGPEKKEKILNDLGAKFLIEVTRGCSYHCAFCNYSSIAPRTRYKSVDTIMKEIRNLHGLGVRNIAFFDSSFAFPRKRLYDLVAALEQSGLKNIVFSGTARIDDLDIEIVTRLAGIGFRNIFLGLESGDDGILKKMKKRLTSAQVKTFFNEYHKKNLPIFFTGSFVIGFPGETDQTLKNTFEFIKTIEIPSVVFQPLQIKTNADIYLHPEQYGLSFQKNRNLRYLNDWEHATMNSQQAVDKAAELFIAVDAESDSIFFDQLGNVKELQEILDPVFGMEFFISNPARAMQILKLFQRGVALGLSRGSDVVEKQKMLWREIKTRFDEIDKEGHASKSPGRPELP